MTSSNYVNDKYTTRQSSYTDNTQSRVDPKYSRYGQQPLTRYSSPSINIDDGATTPSFSENAQTPTRGLTRLSSCRLSVSNFSETSSTRAATPPPSVSSLNVSLNREICSQSTSCAQLINLAVSKGHVFNAVNWATCLHRLAKLFPTEAKNHRSTVIRFLGQAHEVLKSASEGSKFQPQHLATLLWAQAKLSIVDPSFVHSLVEKAIAVIDSLKAQDMANIAWSLAKLNLCLENMFGVICEKIVSCSIIVQFKPMEIASTTWAFGTVGRAGMGVADIGPVMNTLVSECLSRDLRDFSPQALANVLWALSKLAFFHPEMYTQFGNHIVQAHRLREFKPQEIANVVWAMNNVGFAHCELFKEIVSSKNVNWAVFDSHALATVFGGMMDHFELPFALMIAQRVLQNGGPGRGARQVGGFSQSHSGLFLYGLSPFRSHPMIDSAISVLTEKLLVDCSGEGAVLDIFAVCGLIKSLPQTVQLMELLSQYTIVEAEYGSARSMCASLCTVLECGGALAKNALVGLTKNTSTMIYTVAEIQRIVSLGSNFGNLDEWVIAQSVKMDKFGDILQLMKTSETVGKSVPVSVLSVHVKEAAPSEVALLVDLLYNAVPVLALVLSDIVCVRPGVYFQDFESLAQIVYKCCQVSEVNSHVASLLQLTFGVLNKTGGAQHSLDSLAKIVAAGYVLEIDTRPLIMGVLGKTLLGQCCQAGPGGLVLLRENLNSFSLYCRVVAAYVSSGQLPGSWVLPSPPLSPIDTADESALASALALSVALGNIGAVEQQKDIIGQWVLPLMTPNTPTPTNKETVWSISPFFAPTARSERLGSIDLLNMCIPNHLL